MQILDTAAVDIAAERLEAAKRTEEFAKQARIRAEEALLLVLPPKAVGSSTTQTASWKVTTTGVQNVTIDDAALEAVRADIPAALYDKAIRYKPDVIAAGLKELRNNEPDTYAKLAQALTIKPGKTGVTVERVEPQEAAA